MSETHNATLPTAVVGRRRRASWALLLPLITAALVGYLGWQAWNERGVTIEVELALGHGVQAGDPVRYRGIDVGSVRAVHLAPGLDRVRLEVSLAPHAADLARTGTAFWVARPQVGPAGVSGLDTLVGPRYLAVLPGSPTAPHQDRFEGLDAPPIVPPFDGGLEVVLTTPSRGGIAAGAPVLFRQLRVGMVTQIALTSDGSAVELRLVIDPYFGELVRAHTRFWETAGIELEADLLNGLSFEFDSLESILTGGIALATPDDHGSRVRNGHRFELETTAPKGWTDWRPDLPLGASLLPAGSLVPRARRAALVWREGGLFGGSDKSKHGWLLRVAGGLLGPADLVRTPEDARSGSARLEVDGRSIPPLPEDAELGLLAEVPDDGPGAAWPDSRLRRPEAPEDALVFGDPASGPRALSAARFTPNEDGTWHVDRSLSIPGDWHGAPVLAREDGALIGLLLVGKDGARVALVAAP
ncbi:MlaD family protein [Engelhardtia mirabilis]|uniref:Paraquat-inducible protein B n=1 Tax=Engelhardtia mirabilis TaxID=2528011 RepID=A0A518BFQ5_9BACT|nr:Paraquat-inducible protein B [Planctomycetes bacterium Pla133]QDV00143.1 Paraquat-inducible protein B [Planctomycetes bacterium Pla86]